MPAEAGFFGRVRCTILSAAESERAISIPALIVSVANLRGALQAGLVEIDVDCLARHLRRRPELTFA